MPTCGLSSMRSRSRVVLVALGLGLFTIVILMRWSRLAFCSKHSHPFPEPGGDIRVFLYDAEGYARFYSQEALEGMGPTVDQCAQVDSFPFKARFVHSPSERDTAHGVFYNGPQYLSVDGVLETFNREQKALTVWHEPGVARLFPHPYVDIESSLRVASDVPSVYGCKIVLEFLQSVKEKLPIRAPSLDPQRRGTAAVISNCDAKERLHLLQALMGKMKIFSYGKCEHNSDLAVSRGPGRETKKFKILQHHRALLAWENAREPDYVSEKIYDALSANVVPVYWGSDAIKEVLPEGSYIDASGYTSENIDELAAKLKRLDSDDEYYRSFFTSLNNIKPSRK